VTWCLRMTGALCDRIRADLARPHPFAAERVGVLFVRPGAAEGAALLLAGDYVPVADEDYVDNPAVGATIGSRAIRRIMQGVLDRGCGAVHVHTHGGRGKPRFSRVDHRDLPGLVRSFRAVGPTLPHGALVFSDDNCECLVWLPGGAAPAPGGRVSIVGFPTRFFDQGALYA
jgi:hypothetical protein